VKGILRFSHGDTGTVTLWTLVGFLGQIRRKLRRQPQLDRFASAGATQPYLSMVRDIWRQVFALLHRRSQPLRIHDPESRHGAVAGETV
jgi:hypothetical protein